MGTSGSNAIGPNLTRGVPATNIADGNMLVGHVGKETVLLVRRGEKFFAVSASCSHYGASLAEGLVVEDTVRCPWHHSGWPRGARTWMRLRKPPASKLAMSRLIVATATSATQRIE